LESDSSSDKEAPGTEASGRGVSRRCLLQKAGWAVPVVIAVSVPADAHAQVSPGEASSSGRGIPGEHQDPWHSEAITIGGATYLGWQLLPLLKDDDDDNPTRRLAKQLIIAKMNSARGCEPPASVRRVIELAERRLRTYGPLYPDPPPPKNSRDRRDFLAWARVLERHNALHRARP